MNFVMFPMFFFSSALYPLWKLREGGSEFIYLVSLVNPFTHAVELIRFALYGMFEPVSARVVTGATVLFFLLAVIGYDPQRGMIRRSGVAGSSRASHVHKLRARVDPPCAADLVYKYAWFSLPAISRRTCARVRGRAIGTSATTCARAGGEQEQAVGKADRFVDVVGHQQRRDRPAPTSCASSSRSRTASTASSETNGSSSSSRSGSTAKARASATRRASPSDSSPG